MQFSCFEDDSEAQRQFSAVSLGENSFVAVVFRMPNVRIAYPQEEPESSYR